LCVGDNEHFTSEGLSAIVQSCPLLEYLDFTDCRLVDDTLAPVIAEHAHHLQTLLAEFCGKFITDETLTALSRGKCSSLQQLDLVNGTLSDDGIRSLSHAPFKSTLKSIDLRRNEDLSQDSYSLLARDLLLEEIDGVLLSTIRDDIASFFMQKRAMMGDG
jgi:hypothetical protein